MHVVKSMQIARGSLSDLSDPGEYEKYGETSEGENDAEIEAAFKQGHPPAGQVINSGRPSAEEDTPALRNPMFGSPEKQENSTGDPDSTVGWNTWCCSIPCAIHVDAAVAMVHE